MKRKNVLVIGTDGMGQAYGAVLKALKADVTFVGRDEAKASRLARECAGRGFGGGVKALPRIRAGETDLVIVACAVDALLEVTLALFSRGFKRILIEKPGALGSGRLRKLQSAQPRGVVCGVGYNRRFYNSTLMLQACLRKDGGPLGCFFDFTEREQDVLGLIKPPAVMRRWGLVNSSHVIDLAFFLIGSPRNLLCHQSGRIKRHQNGSTFVGHGQSASCAFSYFATWSGGGRWNVEVSTTKGRYKLCPLEELQFCAKNQFVWQSLAAKDQDDIHYKPGLMKMTRAALEEPPWTNIKSLKEQCHFSQTIDGIFGYERW